MITAYYSIKKMQSSPAKRCVIHGNRRYAHAVVNSYLTDFTKVRRKITQNIPKYRDCVPKAASAIYKLIIIIYHIIWCVSNWYVGGR